MPNRTFRFGVFEVHEPSRELRKHGVRLKIQEQPFQILVLLLESPGEIVEREQIRRRLWSPDTFVDFDNAISSAVRKLRETLGDSADNPRFIETLPKRGYRFLHRVELQPPTEPSTEPKHAAPDGRAIIPVIVAVTVLLVGLMTWWLKPSPKTGLAQLTPVPLTAAQGSEQSPTFSPEGDRIAYVWAEPSTSNAAHIYVKTIGSGRSAPLTSAATADSDPAWSPDGRTIAFLRAQDRDDALYVVPAGGGVEKKILGDLIVDRGAADGYHSGVLSWSPDSRLFAVALRKSVDESGSLYLISAENGEKTRLTTPNAAASDQDPRFSPDGKSLLFTRCVDRYTCGLYLLKMTPQYRAAAEPTILLDVKGIVLGTAWTSDGRGIVYSGFPDKTYDPRLMRFAVGNPDKVEPLSYAGERVFAPIISRRGNRFAYLQSLTDFDIWQIKPGKSSQRFATSSTRHEAGPQYSPDGKRVAFFSNRSGAMNIWSSDADGNNLVQLTNSPEYSGTPRWSPDSRWLAFDRHLKSGWHVFVMAADGGQVRQLTTDDGDEVIASFSHDGKWIYYASNRTGRFEIWKAPSIGGKGQLVTHKGGWVAFEAPNGRSIFYTKTPENLSTSNSLWELPIGGTNERSVAVEPIYGRAFTVVDDGIYYVAAPAPGGKASIRFHNFSAATNREIAPLDTPGLGITVSPDRSSILTVLGARIGSNVMVVDDFM